MRLAEEEYSKSCFRADEEKITLTQEPADQSPPSILTSMPIANNLPATTIILMVPAALPLTRKATLEHFMEKRKDR
ncbi:CO/COL/TOC1, conserved site [Corchorus olitorius]|uniref:CO/COL/TOC1, conserved site n=1 Tax=Corchorus olitorius TaxID=93759 RepID=A0A1R3G3N3_9ROSI|nr:CO/COL/TOC1, conserved site [Corchorus olitorius]